MKPFRPVILMILALALTGCEQSPAGLPVAKMQIGKQTFHLEVAATDSSQTTGLMKRDSMPDNHGMIFVFNDEQVREFWMKNTRIPLDIVFLNAAGRVVSIRQMEPYDLNRTSSLHPAMYAIELNKGAAAGSGIKVGDRLTLPDLPKGPKE
ncbi:MAG: exported protein [Phycisphaerales bacterium]|nr:exported protein [Phycisphaerales bacterium]MDB5356329.1 exported protein [Phycisphaerales bacterium]